MENIQKKFVKMIFDFTSFWAWTFLNFLARPHAHCGITIIKCFHEILKKIHNIFFFFYSFNRNEPSVKRPTSIDGLRPHLLEVPPKNHKRAHSEDSLNEIEEEEDDETAKDIGKKHALKKYDQFALNTSCFVELSDQILS